MSLRAMLLLLLLGSAAVARAAESTNDISTGSATSAPPAVASPPPAVMAVVLGAGTGALILSGHSGSDDGEQDGTGGMGKPELEDPPPGVDIVDGGGVVTFTWKGVAGAATYLLDIDACDETNSAACSDYRMEQTPDTTLSVPVPSPFTGRWRVRAVDAQSIAGPYSDYRAFTYRGPLPPP